MDYFGCDLDHTIAIGDGNNDISMLSFVNYGIAMGNATDKLKSIAQHVSDDVNRDGLAKAFYHIGLC